MSRPLLAVFRLNTNRITVSRLRDPDGAVIPGATSTCAVTLLHEDGSQVAGQVWPLALVWDAVNGRFAASFLPSTLVDGQELTVRLDVTNAGNVFYDEQPAIVRLPTIP
jgi:hypothetical protein